MAFGSGKYVCPSKRMVGPMLIGIMVAALAERLRESFELVGEGGEKFGFGDNLLESGREVYRGLRLKKVAPN